MEYDSSILEGSIYDYEPEQFLTTPGSPLSRFAEHVDRPEEYIDLIEAALLIASDEYPGLNIGYYLQRFEIMANDVRLLLADETDPHRAIEVLNTYLFNTLGFKGNQEDYNDPRNSYLNDVLERRIGIPITLSLLYIEVGKQVGLPLEGVGLPGHFIVRYRSHAPQTTGRWKEATDNIPAEDEDILLDPFNAGAVLTEEDCARLLREVYGRPVPLLQTFLSPITNRQFLGRMLNNLKNNYLTLKEYDRAVHTEQFLMALEPESWEEVRDRGIISYRAGHRWQAVIDMQSYLKHNPKARDANLIKSQITDILGEISKNN